MDGRWLLPLTSPPVGPECGVEHEFQVHSEHRQVDFRELLPRLTAGLVARDPGDPRAYRLPHGAGLTADGWEAELVTAPVPLCSAGLQAVVASLRQAERELSAELPGLTLTGFSTHLNVSAPDRLAVGVANKLARHCLAALDTLVRPDARTGYLVRPRRGRMEVGTDFLDAPRTVVGLAVLAACVQAMASGDDPPQDAASSLARSREKFGWFAGPEDLGPSSARTVAWVDAHVRDLGLPSILDDHGAAYRELAETAPTSVGPAYDASPRQRGRLSIGCTWLTWRLTVWSIVDHATRHTVYAVLPVADEPGFLTLLDAGALDLQLSAALRSPRTRTLLTHAQTARPALWTAVRPGALVPAERAHDGSVPRVSRRHARRDLRRLQSTARSTERGA